MKRKFFNILFLVVMFCCANVAYAQNIGVIYAIRSYHSATGNYIEINTSIDASALESKLLDGNYIKQAELTTIVCPYDKIDSALYVEKRIISTPRVQDSSSLNNISLSDMQRIALSCDTCVIFFELRDINTKMQPMYYKDAVIVNYPKDYVSVSDIMLIDNYEKSNEQQGNIYTKNGYDIYPYIYDEIVKEKNILDYYVEIYNADKNFGENNYYVVFSAIEDMNTNKKVENIQKVKRIKSESLTPLLSKIDISTLSEGSYYLTVEVRGSDNVLYAYKRYPFFRQSDNKIIEENVDIPQDAFVNNISEEELKENIRCLRPIATDAQVRYMLKNLKTSTPTQDRYFLYQFYKAQNPLEPQRAWKDYMNQVAKVNKKYSTAIKKGYATDMGRVILMYGEPDNIIDEKFGVSSISNANNKFDERMNPDASSMDVKGVSYYPYQIWVYNHTPFGESNRKFVFYAKQDNLAEYFLLHSNARGELQDMYWENTLSHGTLEQGVMGTAGKQFQRGYK